MKNLTHLRGWRRVNLLYFDFVSATGLDRLSRLFLILSNRTGDRPARHRDTV